MKKYIMKGERMKKFIILLALVSVAFAGLVPGQTRDTWVEGEVNDTFQMPGTPIPGKGADVLFIFAAYSNAAGLAWGSTYWNPDDIQFPSTWNYDAVNPSTVEPTGLPYHWYGGLGTAMDNLGLTWEWYPTWDNEDAMQVLPDVATLQDYDVVFVHTFDNWWNSGLSDGSTDILGDYMDAGGKVIFIGQDSHYGGLSATWLDDYFLCGTITDDVVNGDSLVTAYGTSGTFLDGWSGTADKANFSDANGFYVDQVSDNGFIDDGSAVWYASYDDAAQCLYSTLEFEACAASEVEDIADCIKTYMGLGGALQQSTWGDIKTSF
jgi:hypothetical protein